MTCPSCGAENTYGGRPRTVLEGMDDPVGGSLLPGGMEVGSLVREYRLVRKLGEGGMGEVYEARHDLTHQHVAIKVVAPELLRDDNTRRRFVEEARVMAGLDHHNIVRLHTFIEEQGRFFLVMEFLVGESLEERLEKGPLPLDEGIRVMRGLLEALSMLTLRKTPSSTVMSNRAMSCCARTAASS
jgi:serine/threonine protein kinase